MFIQNYKNLAQKLKNFPFKRKRRLSRDKRRRLIIYTSIILCTTLLTLFVLWSFSLFNQLEIITSQRALRRPTEFYVDYENLKTGMHYSMQKLISHLNSLGYKQTSETPFADSQYYIIDNKNIDVFFRTFIYPKEQIVSGLHRFTFKNSHLKRIEKFPEDKKLKELPLEPMPLGGFSKEGAETRPWIPLDKIPSTLKLGVLISEDKRFFQHFGIDPRSLIRAIWINFRKGGVYQGGSTLTQQLIKNAFLTHKRTIKRKIKEAFLAIAMEIRYDKNTIFEMYLNQIYLGKNGLKGVYGVEDASLSYFGKHVSELSLGECALIVGLIPAPNVYNPRMSIEKAVQKRDIVLQRLLRNNCISKRNWEQAMEEDIVLKPMSSEGVGNYFLSHVMGILEEEFSETALDFQGYKVFTTLDWSMQIAAEKAILNQELEGAIIAMDPYNGYVKALVGGRYFIRSQFNRAINAYRHPGSAFKPILYASGIESELITLTTFIEDKPIKIEKNEKIWEPQNYDSEFCGTITVRDALVYSKNIPAVNLLEIVGTDRVIDLAKSLGIKSELLPVPSLALGTSEVTPIELTGAYAAFANGGLSVKPIFIKLVTDSKGNILKEYNIETSRAMSQETAFIITDVLKDVIKRGTGKNVLRLGFDYPSAGKTGTSDNFYDAWFIGFTPKILCGVWLGHDKPESLNMAAAHLALPVWVDFMKAVHKDKEVEEFEKYSKVKYVSLDPETLLRARSGCPKKIKELYIKGTEPKEYCPLHQGGIPGFFKRLFGDYSTEEEEE